MERAERFGIVTKEISEQRIKQRQERFGIETKESLDAKKQERMKRFGSMEEASQIGISSEELEKKRKARMERFGAAEVQEAQKEQKNQQENGAGFKMNRRRNKMFRKNFQKGGKRTIVLQGGDGNKNKQKGGQ